MVDVWSMLETQASGVKKRIDFADFKKNNNKY